MQNIPVKLNVTPAPFNYFEDNQVLTATQLNNAVRYFDYQDRLTRTRLIGAGIVCGLKVVYNAGNITITKGCGITSDGDIINLSQDIIYEQVTDFDDSKAQYPQFRTEQTQIALHALMTREQQAPGNQPSVSVAEFFRQYVPGDFVVLLYLSSYLEDTDICSSVDCDNKGILQQNNLQALLVNKADYERMRQEPDCCSEQYFDMPDAYVPRVIFNPASDTYNYNNFKIQYQTAIDASLKELAKPLQMADDLAASLQKCFLSGGEVPNTPAIRVPVRPGINPNILIDSTVLSRINAASLRLPASLLNRFSALKGSAAADFQARVPELLKTAQAGFGIQYLYDFIKDVAVAYTEFRESAFDLCQGCCISPDLFPKHLAIGLVQGGEEQGGCHYRQCFIESPILNNKDEELRKAMFLYNRLIQIIQNYSYDANNRDQGVRVTPTVTTERPLGEKSVPYYYNASSLNEEWDYERFRRRKTDTHLSYYGAENAPQDKPHIRQPLDYDLDKYNFFRVEGHVGKIYENVYSQLDKLREAKDLPFEIMGLQLDAIRRFVIPKWEFNPPHLEVLHELNKFKLSDYLDKLKLYNDDLEKKMPTENELSINGLNEYYGNPKDLRSKALDKKKDLDDEITQIKPLLNMNLMELKTRDFAPIHESIATKAAVVNNGAKLLTRATLSTPLQNVAQLHTPAILDWIKNLAVDSSEALKDSYIFMNFLKDNPSLLHNAGVQKGGTFLIVYAVINRNNRDERVVVGDFYVPYIVQPQQVAKPSKPLPIKPIIPIRPTLPPHIFDLVPDFRKPPILNLDIKGLQDMLNDTKIKVDRDLLDFNNKVLDIDNSVRTKLGTLATKGEVQTLVTENLMNVARDYKQNFDSVVNVIKTKDLTAGGKLSAEAFGVMELDDNAIRNLSVVEMEKIAANYNTALQKLQKRDDFKNYNFRITNK